jgi:hypothetical protein
VLLLERWDVCASANESINMNTLPVPSNLFRHLRIDNSSALYLGQVELRWRTSPVHFLEAIAHSTLGQILPRVSRLEQLPLRGAGLFLFLEDEGDARVTLPPTIYTHREMDLP